MSLARTTASHHFPTSSVPSSASRPTANAAPPRPPLRARGPYVRVEPPRHGATADGVYRHADTGIRRALNVGAQLCPVHRQHAGVVGPLIRLLERRGLRAERTVGEDLQVR